MIRPLPARKVREALLAKGFRLSERSGRDHEMYFMYVADQTTAFFVKLSRGAPEMRQDEIRNSARQMKTTGDKLFRILSCEYSADRTIKVYEETLTAR
jgi:hypothetical protein